MGKLAFSLLVISLLGISLLFLTACSDNDVLTGGSVIEVSTLDVAVRSENGTLLPSAEIYVNNIYKGKTAKYGENIGTATVVLSGGENEIHAQKEGYVSSEPTSVSASLRGHQQISIVLEKKKTDIQIKVENQGERVANARVSLHKKDKSLPPETGYSNKNGRVEFEQVDDGNYILSVSKEGFELYNHEETINYLTDGDELSLNVELILLPGLAVEVLDTVGDPLPFAEVALYSENIYNTPGGLPFATELSSYEGKAFFSSVEYGEKYVVVVKKADYLIQSKSILLEPERRELKFEMVFDID